MPGPALISGETGRRVLNAIRRLEGETDSPRGDDRGAKTASVWAFVKPTGNGGIVSGYPGVALLPTASNNLFDSDANSEQVWIYTVDIGIPLDVGSIYVARLSGWDDAKAKSTWQAFPHCCSKGEPEPVPPGGGPCSSSCNGPACLEVVIEDWAGARTNIFLPKSTITSPGDCSYPGILNLAPWQTANDWGYVALSIGAGSPGGTSVSLTSSAARGSVQAHQDCVTWNGAGNFPLPPMGPFGLIPQFSPHIVSAQARDASFCSGGAGGGGAGGGGGTSSDCLAQCNRICTDAYGDPPPAQCVNDCFQARCLGGVTPGGPKFSGCTSGSCGCGGACGSSTLSPALAPLVLPDYGLINYTNLVASGTVKPISESYADIGCVGAGEDTLYTDTIDANTLAIGDSVHIDLAWKIVAGRARLYFGGIKIYDTGGIGLVNVTKAVRVVLTRSGSGTARAVLVPSNENAQYVDETTLTGLNFGSAVTILATGEGSGTDNDIKTVQAAAVRIPSSATLTSLGVTTVQILSYGPDSQLSIPFSAADYTGAGATTLDTGSASGASDVDVYVVPTADIAAGQVVRVFKEVAGGAVSLEKAALLDPRTLNPADPTCQDPIYICTVKIIGTSEKVKLSKEVNAALLAKGKRKNYYST